MNRDVTIGERAKKELFQVLMEEVSAYDYLAEIIAEKQQAIIQNNVEKVEHYSGVEQLLVTKANQLTGRRVAVMKKIMADQRSREPISLKRYIQQLNIGEQTTWQKLEQRLNSTIQKIRSLNEKNKYLLEQSIDYIRGMIELFIPQDEFANTLYHADGKDKKKVAAKNLMDVKA